MAFLNVRSYPQLSKSRTDPAYKSTCKKRVLPPLAINLLLHHCCQLKYQYIAFDFDKEIQSASNLEGSREIARICKFMLVEKFTFTNML